MVVLRVGAPRLAPAPLAAAAGAAATSKPAYRGPLPCNASQCAPAPAPALAAQYDYLAPAQHAEVAFDVGGGMQAEAAGVLLALWDARVPPEAFWSAQPHRDGPSGEQPEGADFVAAPAFLHAATSAYGLSPAAAAAFARSLYYLQRFADGVEALAGVPAEDVVGATPAAAAALRWAAPSPPNMAQGAYVERFAACIGVGRGAAGALRVTAAAGACGSAGNGDAAAAAVTVVPAPRAKAAARRRQTPTRRRPSGPVGQTKTLDSP